MDSASRRPRKRVRYGPSVAVEFAPASSTPAPHELASAADPTPPIHLGGYSVDFSSLPQANAPNTSQMLSGWDLTPDDSVFDWESPALETNPFAHHSLPPSLPPPPTDVDPQLCQNLAHVANLPASVPQLQSSLQGTAQETHPETAIGGEMWSESTAFNLFKWPDVIVEDGESLNRKRVRELASLDEDHIEDSSAAPTDVQWMRETFPLMFASVPYVEDRTSSLVPNPFLEGSEEKYKSLDIRIKPRLPANGMVDGYIKIRFSRLSEEDYQTSPSDFDSPPFDSRRSPSIRVATEAMEMMQIPPLPPNFATGMELDDLDRTLWSFHIHAYCPGRMILPENYFGIDLVPIAVGHPGVRHALLCHTASYVLDYQPTEEMRKRANFHYRSAVQQLSSALALEDTYKVGLDDAAVASIIMIFSSDIVNWETRRPKDQQPLWLEGAQAARQILDLADPGYRYWKPENVQSTAARRAHANWVAYVLIMAQPVSPLTGVDTLDHTFQWLLEGSKEDVHQIQGITGFSPKLLHIFCQITHLAARLAKAPGSGLVVRLGADRLARRLQNFWQWSTLSHGHQTYEELIASNKLGEDGKVCDPAAVTELTAYAWVPAAEIYLNCRVYRKQRSHPDVIKSLDRLAMCIYRLPCSGPLFTSQSPFFPVFMMAAISFLPRHRRITRDWFETVLEGAECRSSVPPVWMAIQSCWKWMDADTDEDLFDETLLLADRAPWWEEMVARLVEDHGILSLV